MPTGTALDQLKNAELAQQLYDALMVDIEPDLLLANIPLLDERYAGETEEERRVRMKRYEEAYKEFDAALATFMGSVRAEVKTAKRQSLREKETKERAQEETNLTSLEQAFQ